MEPQTNCVKAALNQRTLTTLRSRSCRKRGLNVAGRKKLVSKNPEEAQIGEEQDSNLTQKPIA